jgi:hypothetical protein
MCELHEAIERESRIVVVHRCLTPTVRGGFPSIPIACNDFYYARVYEIFFFDHKVYKILGFINFIVSLLKKLV